MSARATGWVGRRVLGGGQATAGAFPRQPFAERAPAAAPAHFESRVAPRWNFVPQRFSTSSSASCLSWSPTTSSQRPAYPSLPPPPPPRQPQHQQQQQPDMDIEELHRLAISEGHETYVDPSTGLTVFTELAHRLRGRCCGSRCRHCPYNDWTTTTQASRSAASAATSNNGHGSDSECSFQSSYSSAHVAESRPSTTTTTSLPDHLTCNGTPKNLLESPNTAPGNGGDGANGRTPRRKKNVPYTRTGDGGTSQLMTGERRSKDSAVFDAMGTVDELCSTVGLAHSLFVAAVSSSSSSSSFSSPSTTAATTTASANGEAPSSEAFDLADCLVQVMSRLFDIGSHIAKPRKVRQRAEDESDSDSDAGGDRGFVPDGVGGGFDAEHAAQLEAWIDDMTERLPELRSFILPTGSVASAQLHVSRCVCRRAERLVVTLVSNGVCDPNAVRYLNRLSDFLFVAARYANVRMERRDEVLYKKPSADAKQRVAAARGNSGPGPRNGIAG